MTATDGITVAGSGRVATPPDYATLSLGVGVMRDSVAAAIADAAVKIDGVIGVLHAHGVSAEDTQTSEFSVGPEYDHRQDEGRLVGYRVNNTLTAILRDIASVGSVVDAVAEAAGDDVRIGRIGFEADRNEELRAMARRLAWEDASAKASQLAKLAGVTLGSAVTIRETSMARPPRMMAMERAAMSTSIEGGSAEIAVDLEVRFAIGTAARTARSHL